MTKLYSPITHFWMRSIRRQLVLGIALVHAVMMSIFVYDLVTRQQEFLHQQSLAQTKSLANALAVSSVSWLLADDVVGMQEVVSSLSRYPGVRYAMLIQPNGQIAAHTDESKIGLFLSDATSLELLREHQAHAAVPGDHEDIHLLINNRQVIDLAMPIRSGDKVIGMARVAIGQDNISTGLNVVTRNGVLYTLGAIIIGTLFALLIGTGLARRLVAIAGVADAFRRGRRDIRADVSREDEIGHLANGLNTMLDVVSEREVSLAASEERFDLAMQGANDGLWDWDIRNNKVYFSPRWKSMIGCAPEEIPNELEEWHCRVHPDDLLIMTKEVESFLAGSIPTFEVEFRFCHKDGHYIWVLARGTAQHDEQGVPIRLVGTHVDITERKHMTDLLRLDASIMDSAQEGILITDAEHKVVRVNHAFTKLTGYAPDEIIGQNPSILSSGLHDDAFYAKMWESINDTGSWHGEVWNRKKNGETYAEILGITSIRNEQGQVEYYAGIFTDITELKNTQLTLEHLANYDPLTGLPNRSLMSDRLQQAIAATRRQGNSLAVCFLDLDGFKEINDQYGHDIGDRLLIEISRRLTSAIRGSDTVARLGGDEFVLLLEGPRDNNELDIAISRILEDITVPCIIDKLELHVSASIGIALYPQHNTDPDTLIRYADQAMYHSKQAGRNCYHVFDAEHDQQTQSRYQLVGRLQYALKQGELLLHYQPQVDMRNGLVIGMEALLRWNHPETGMIPPAEFLPFIEDNDLIIDIGEWVLHKALDQIQAWAAEGITCAVSVNIAARHLQRPDFVERLKTILSEHSEVSPSLLELEVLESAVIENIGHARATLLDCRELGISIALDDFGTGYSSLSYLKHLPADVLKIDRSFIRDLLEDEDDLDIARGVIGLGDVFHRAVVAEGVETPEHGVLLLRMGCNIGQGYGISRPMPAESVPQWLTSFHPDLSWKIWAHTDWPLEDYPLLVGQYDHLKWIARILQIVEDQSSEAGKIAAVADHHCRFGAWYEDRGVKTYGDLPIFKEIAPFHQQVHKIGLEMLRQQAAGQHEAALALREELIKASDRFVEQLATLQQTVANKGKE